MLKRLIALVTCLSLISACTPIPAPAAPAAAPQPAAETAETVEVDLAAVKAYAVNEVTQMKAAASALHQTAQTYYDRIEQIKQEQATADPYQYFWDNNPEEVGDLLAKAKEHWTTTHVHYELNEGIVAGVPSLAYYDVWIDAGPSGEEDPAEALDWQLELPDGTSLEKPGNLFHSLAESAIWGTRQDFVGLTVDLDGDGTVEIGEAMPEANIFLGVAQGLDEATLEMDQAIANWEPTLEDAFAALVTMTPTMNEYFEQWKLSVFVSGAASTEQNFVAASRLLDVTGILNSLNITFDQIKPVVEQADPQLSAQIDTGMDDLVAFVNDLYTQEQNGKQFTPEDADLLGSKAQDEATALAGQMSQAAALLEITIEE